MKTSFLDRITIATVLLCILNPCYSLQEVQEEDTILDAKNNGKNEAIIAWNEFGLDCSKVEQFKEVVQRGIYKQCDLFYKSKLNLRSSSSSSSVGHVNDLIFSCKVGADEIYEEKIHLCDHHDCKGAGKVLARPVSAILCHYVALPWSVEMIPESCIPQAKSSCIESTIATVKTKVNSNECHDIAVNDQNNEVHAQADNLCGIFIHAFSTFQSGQIGASN